MRFFYLDRIEDESGVSGTGRVAEGVIFTDGSVAMKWLTKAASLNYYSSLDDLIAIHGHGGKTQVRVETMTARQMQEIPNNNGYLADRYDTDDQHVIHMWHPSEQVSYDVRIPKHGS